MAELLHYLDKMEYRPTPKQAAKIRLKLRPDQEVHTTTDEHLMEIVDKRRVSGFKRVVIKEYERIIGVVQEKKRRSGDAAPTQQIYLELRSMEDDETTVPIAKQITDEEMPLEEPKTPDTVSRELDERMKEFAEEEPVLPEDKSLELDERLEEIQEEEPKTPEDKSRELDQRLEEEKEEDEEPEQPVKRKKNKKQTSDENVEQEEEENAKRLAMGKSLKEKKYNVAVDAFRLPAVEIRNIMKTNDEN
jgi:hypothetical protein